jgi:hypothetical protein
VFVSSQDFCHGFGGALGGVRTAEQLHKKSGSAESVGAPRGHRGSASTCSSPALTRALRRKKVICFAGVVLAASSSATWSRRLIVILVVA